VPAGAAAVGAPHLKQNAASGVRSAPQREHEGAACLAPHEGQKAAPSGSSRAQAMQTNPRSLSLRF